MKIIFHEKYFDVYSSDPASAKGRLDNPYRVLREFGVGFHMLVLLDPKCTWWGRRDSPSYDGGATAYTG
jgi:hypothetical protein